MERKENLKRKMKEIVLFVDELESELASGIPFCRICHEIEFESCKSLEAPCSCSGTLKFAHRDCTQRWCDEKGNTTCEICLQNFEPGYTVPIEKAQLLDAVAMIRGSLEGPRRERGQENLNLNEQLLENECSTEAAHWRANCLKLLALIVTMLLLTRHLLTLLTDVTEDGQFTVLALLIAKTSGIVLPIYVIMIVIITLIRNIFRNRHPDEEHEDEVSNSETREDEENEDQRDQDHVVEIHSSSS